jgi:hypothetical protein
MVPFETAESWNRVASGTVVADVESGCAYVVCKRREWGVAVLTHVSKGRELEIPLNDRINHERWKAARNVSVRAISTREPRDAQ